jgi:CHAT domain-containing protein
LLGLSRAGQDSSPSYRRAAALFELRTADTSTRGISRAIRSLEGARRLAPHDPTVLNDLAVAYLELGQRDQRLEPMLRALDAIEQALERDSTSAPALFNRALISERLYLNASARSAWLRYLAVERNAQWRAEADQHLARLTARRDRAWPDIRSSPLQDGGSPPDTIIALVAYAPQDARDSAFALLREWGMSIRSGQKARATNLLVTVRAIARSLDSLDLDRSVSLAVHAIDADTTDRARLARMASALVDLADGTALFWKGSTNSAIACLTRAEGALRSLGSPAARWAAFYHAWSEIEQGHHTSADQRFARLLSKATPQEPALRGKALWGQGVSQLRRANYENAIRQYRASRDSLVRAREPENDAGIFYVLSEALELAGQSSAARDEAYRGLKRLSPFRRSNYLNNHLTNVALLARREGLGYAAVAIVQEVLDVAPRVGKPQVVAWANRAYARELMMLGRRAAAHAALDSAERWIDSIPAGTVHARVAADVRFVSAQLARGENPRQARKTLAAVAATFAKQKLQMHVARALYEESVAAAAAGDSADARRTLDQAIGAIERQSRSFTSTDARATFSETVENLFDEMMNRQLAAKHRDSAFVYLERGRQAAWSGGATPTDKLDLDRIRLLLPPDMLVVEYAVLPTQLVVWTASKDRSQADVQTIARDSIATLVDRAIEEMDNPADSAIASPRLFDLLLGKLPIDRSRITKLAIIPDRELSRLPFAALRDTKGRYLIESFEMRTAPSAAFLVAAFGRQAKLPMAGRALVVGNPLLDTSSAQLPPLPGALREAQGVAKAYPSPRLLTGADARRDSVLALLATSSVFHFAGHAIINSDQPELSYLALASTGSGSADGGILRAREIGNLHPSNLQLAVLSACSTLNPRPSHTGAIAGLAYSFLRAGVPATISTLWDVSDEAVTDVLVDFHRQRMQGKPAAEALRSAQVAAIKKRSAPRAWAAFIYTGR